VDDPLKDPDYEQDSELSMDTSDDDEGVTLEQMINQITGVNDVSNENEPSTSVRQPAAEQIDMIASTSDMVKSSDKVTSDEGRKSTKRESRPYYTVHCCKFCSILRTHIHDHLEKKDKDESDV
jgi:hypothetical protein